VVRITDYDSLSTIDFSRKMYYNKALLDCPISELKQLLIFEK